jgi:PAS domain S-box-containing protein
MTVRDRKSNEIRLASPSSRGLWALAFVAVSLGAIVVIPALYGRRVTEVQTRTLDVLEPAARHSSGLTLILARQMAAMQGFLRTGDRATFREPYLAAIREKHAVLDTLGLLARDLERQARDEVFERVARLGSASTRWDFTNQQLFDDGPGGDASERTEESYAELQQATRELNRAIASVVAAGRLDIEEALALHNRITYGIALVALLATMIVARVAYRYRELIVERERRRREAVRARREIDSLLEATGDGVLGIDLEGKCTALNPAGAKLLGYSEREIIGRDLHDTIFHSLPDGAPSPRGDSPVLKALSAGEPLDSRAGDVLWRRKRVAFPARWALRPLIDGVELRGAVLTFTDMTEIQQKEEALRRAIRQREDVVSIVSHDLRNPLGVALAAADLLLDLPLDPEQRRRQAEIITRSGRRMQSLIEALLDVARIEAGAFVVRPSLEELGPILEEARDDFRDQAERKGVELLVDPFSSELSARVDRDRIIQALANLLDNAIRLTPEGGCVVLGLRDDVDEVAITVSDTGPGIAPKLLDHLFDRFAQVDQVGKGGAGLGLAIVKGVAEAHDGTVNVESRLGVGTTFALAIPKAGPPLGEEGLPIEVSVARA